MTPNKPRLMRQLWNPALADERAVKVFDHWRGMCDHPKARLDKERHDLLMSYVLIGYSVDDLCTAIDGCVASEWHQGGNPGGVVYDKVGTIFADADRVDSLMRCGEQAHRMIEERKARRAEAEQIEAQQGPPSPEQVQRAREMLKSVKLKRVA